MPSTECLLEDGSPDGVSLSCPEKAILRGYTPSEYSTDLSTPPSSPTSIYSTSSASTSATSVSSPSLNEKYPLPSKKGVHGLRALRYRFFCIYRRLFSVVFVGNMIALILMLRSPKERRLEKLATAMATNLTASILIRQDHVVNLLYTIACSIPTSAPLWIRRRCAQIYHIGGLHSGLAVASVFWLLAFTILATLQHAALEVLLTSWFIVLFLVVILALAHPTFRARFHNHFEVAHRFAGWTALVLFWLQTVLFVSSSRATTAPLGTALLKSPGIWMLAVTTGSILFTWLELRKVPVETEILSSHAARITFPSCVGRPIPGTAVKISTRPLLEWHSFATIAESDRKGFSIIVSKAGDWTSRIISHPPTTMYIRGVPTCGFMRVVPMFKKILLVATGSGIAPLLPHIYAQLRATEEERRDMPKLRIFWSTPDPVNTFGKDIIAAILAVDEHAVIHDTRTMGRPDMLDVTWRLLKESESEAMAIVSNKTLTDKVVYGIETRGYPAFGALWDS